MNFEAMYSSPSQARFFSPSKSVWGHGVSFEVVPYIKVAKSVEIYVDVSILDLKLCRELAGMTHPQLVIKVQSGMPITDEVIDFCNLHSDLPELVVIIGGGSTADFAKAGIAQRYFGFIDGLGVGANSGRQIPNGNRPLVIAIPTTSGSGAESSRYVVTYEKDSKRKRHGKSWDLISDIVLLDPLLLTCAPKSLIISTAFDAFIHFFESYFCREEATMMSRGVSLMGMSLILDNLSDVQTIDLTSRNLQELLFAGSLSGIAISNTRTGHVHEAAGSLLEQCNLSHSQTLWVFFPKFLSQLSLELPEETLSLLRKISALSDLPLETASDLTSWWYSRLASTDFVKGIESELKKPDNDVDHMVRNISNHVLNDSVWVNKESPVKLTAETITSFVRDSLAPYLTASLGDT